MKLIAVVGNTGCGKTHLLRNLIIKNNDLNIKSVAFDINNEYLDICHKCFFDKDELLNYLNKNKNLQVIIDEATAFFSYRSFDNNFNKIMQLKRHNNHLIFVVYHSLRFVPQYVRMYLNYLFLFQTNDSEKEFEKFGIEKPQLKKFEYKLFKIM